MQKYYLPFFIFSAFACNPFSESGIPETFNPSQLECTGASYTAQGTSLVAQWTKVEQADNYKLVCQHSGGEIEVCSGWFEECTYNNFNPGTDYTCTLSGSGPVGSGTCGNTFQFRALGAFQNASSSVDSATSVTLRWSNSLGADSYRLDEVNAAGAWIRTISSNALSPATVTGLSALSTTHFQVTAYAANNTRQLAQRISLTTAASGPAFTTNTPFPNSGNEIGVVYEKRSDITNVVLRYGTQSGTFTSSSNCSSSPCYASNLTPGVLHYFRLEGTNSQNQLETGSIVSGTPIGAPVLASLQQTAAGTVTLNWNAIPGALNYRVAYDTTATLGLSTMITDATTGLSTTVSGLTAGQLYYFRLQPANIQNFISGDPESLRPVGEFTFQSISITFANTLHYHFTQSIGATVYEIKRGTFSGTYGSTTSTTNSPAMDPNLAPNVDYFIRIIAQNTEGGRLESIERTGRALETPTFTLTPSGADLQANWTARQGVTYSIAHGPTPFAFPNGIQTNISSPCVITGLTYGNSYSIRLSAQNAFGTVHSSPLYLNNFYSPSGGGSIGGILRISGPNPAAITAVTVGGQAGMILSKDALEARVLVMPGSTSGNISITLPYETRTINGYTLAVNNPPNFAVGSPQIPADAGILSSFSSVAISAEGTMMLAGSFNNSRVWTYVPNNGVWTPEGPGLIPENITAFNNEGFGRSVALSADGTKALISAGGGITNIGTAWFYSRANGTWSREAGPMTGTGVSGSLSTMSSGASMSADGNTAVLGNVNDNSEQGASWVFARTNGTWAQQGSKLVGSGGSGTPRRGVSHALSADGNMLVVGGFGDNNNAGAIWIFTRSNGTWSQQGTKLTGTGASGSPKLGTSVAINANGTTVIAGGPGDNNNNGATWVFTRSNTTWTQQGSKLVGGNSNSAEQGFSVSLTADGNTALIGGRSDTNSGAIWYFKRTSTTWSQSGNKVKPMNLPAGGGFAENIALSSDGSTAAVTQKDGFNLFQGSLWTFRSP